MRLALRRKWVIQGLYDRAVEVTKLGKREMRERFGLEIYAGNAQLGARIAGESS